MTVALSGDYGKPRPAVVVQSDDYGGVDTVLVCPMTTAVRDADAFRLTVQPTPANGLHQFSQAMIDKLSPARREKCGPPIGRLTTPEMAELSRRALALLGAG